MSLVFLSSRLTWLHPVGDHVLWLVHSLHKALQGGVEWLYLIERQIQDCVSRCIVIVYPHHMAFAVHAVQRNRPDLVFLTRWSKDGAIFTPNLALTDHKVKVMVTYIITAFCFVFSVM